MIRLSASIAVCLSFSDCVSSRATAISASILFFSSMMPSCPRLRISCKSFSDCDTSVIRLYNLYNTVPRRMAAAMMAPYPEAKYALCFFKSDISHDWRTQLPCNFAIPICRSKCAACKVATVVL